MPWLFLLAYTSSGVAGLVYEVTWTRLLTLYIGHTTAAASAVVAAFLGGLALGAAGGGVIASRLTPRRALQTYALLEIAVVIAAVLLPLELRAFRPLLEWAYNSGASGVLFPAVRLASCLAMVCVPAIALGATFPLAIRWYASGSTSPEQPTALLYFLNTAGAAAGAVLAGFVLIPSIGMSGATWVAMAGSALAGVCALALARTDAADRTPPNAARVGGKGRRAARKTSEPRMPRPWLASAVLGLSGFAALVHEIAWTRILALLLGPTIYAFAATLAAVITGVAVGSGLATAVIRRTRHPAVWLTATLIGAAVTTSVTFSLAGQAIPRLIVQQMAAPTEASLGVLQQALVATAILILPTAICSGAAFPLALALARDAEDSAAGRFGLIYAVNTLGAVSGSLLSGFVLIPLLGLQNTLRVVSASLIAAALVVAIREALSRPARIAGFSASAIAVALLVLSPSWDRDLLASGAYLYAPYVPKDFDLEALLKAGTLLYYREGASATVSVKRLTGTTTLAVDGKTDASNRGDMLTQKLVAHLPLLLHDNPREVGIIGLGSGVTVGAALSHPIARAEVIEISREVVEASQFFLAENHAALADPRTRLIVGDGRSHLLLTRKKYDVIVSEPSNPWIAGVAALFTREFFLAARERLAPGGVICQWANAYNISERDLRSIVATFLSVFPHGTAWLVGADDVLLVAGEGELDSRLSNIEKHWGRSNAARDLAEVDARDPFSVLSLFVGGPQELARYSSNAATLTDDTMTLEFSGPHAIRESSPGANGAALLELLDSTAGPEVLRRARASATAANWRNRGAMMTRRDAHSSAYDDYMQALTLDPTDAAALDGLVRSATLTGHAGDALAWIKSLTAGRTVSAEMLVATSKLLAASGAPGDAIEAARQATRAAPASAAGFAQLASLHADAGDAAQLDAAIASLRAIASGAPATEYYAAVSAFLRGDAAGAVAIAERAIAAHPDYAPVYDLAGAAHTKLGQPDKARAAFEASLRFDPHDSTAYTNLGLLDLAAGHHDAAARHFAEALWLAPESPTAREGLARAKGAGSR